MLQCKSFLVTGSTTFRDGGYHKDLMGLVDAALNSFLVEVNEKGGELVDLKPNITLNPGASQDFAFITVIVKYPDTKNVSVDEPKITFSKKK